MSREYIAVIRFPDLSTRDIDMLDYFDEEELHNLPHKIILQRFEKEMIKKYPSSSGTSYPNLWSD